MYIVETRWRMRTPTSKILNLWKPFTLSQLVAVLRGAFRKQFQSL